MSLSGAIACIPFLFFGARTHLHRGITEATRWHPLTFPVVKTSELTYFKSDLGHISGSQPGL